MQQRLMQQMLSNFEGDDPSVEAGENMAWISVHEDVDGPKLRKLAKRLGTDKATALGILVFLWFWGLRNADETGRILDADREDIEMDLMSVTNLNICYVVDKLFDGGWLEERDGDIYIHDWDHWQEQWYKMLRTREYNTKKKREARAAIKQAGQEAVEQGDPAPETPPPDEPPKTPPDPPQPKVPEEQKYTVEFEQFWKVYPRKVDKGMAYKKYQARRKDGFSDDQLIAAATNYAARCKSERTETKFIKHPKTFLSDSMPFMDFLPKQTVMVSARVTNGNPYEEWGDGHG